MFKINNLKSEYYYKMDLSFFDDLINFDDIEQIMNDQLKQLKHQMDMQKQNQISKLMGREHKGNSCGHNTELARQLLIFKILKNTKDARVDKIFFENIDKISSFIDLKKEIDELKIIVSQQQKQICEMEKLLAYEKKINEIVYSKIIFT